MFDDLALSLPTGYQPGQDIIHPDDPPGEWDWLIALITEPIRASVWNSVVSFVGHEMDILLGPLREIRDRVQWAIAAVYAIPTALYQRLAELRDQIVTSLNYWLWRVTSAAHDLRNNLVGSLAGLPHVIGGYLYGMIGNLVGSLAGLPHVIGGYLAGLVGPLIGPLQQLPHLLGSHLVGLLAPVVGSLVGLRERLVSAAHGMVAWIVGVIETLPTKLGQVAHLATYHLLVWLQSVWEFISGGAAEITFGVLTMGTRVLSETARVLAQGPPPELKQLTDQWSEMLVAGYRSLEGLLLAPGDLTPEMAPSLGLGAFVTAAGLGFGAHLLSTAIELVHPLRYVGLHYLSGFMADMGSFAPIANALTGTLVKVSVANPMQYYAQAMTRGVLPTGGDLQAMRRKHNITAAEFAKYMAYQGYSDFWIQRFEEYLPADPRMFEILRMAETHLPTGTPPADALPFLERLGIKGPGNPNWWLEMKFALAGYNWIDIPQLIETVRLRLTNSARLRFIATSSLMFRNGYMTEDQYRLELAEAGQNPTQVEWRTRAERLSALKDDIDDLVKLYTDQYLKDVITEADLLVALVNAGVTPNKSQILTDRAVIRKFPKPTKPSKAEETAELRKFQTKASELYRRQYQADLITEAEYFESLLSIGITERLAAVTVQIEAVKRTTQSEKVAIQDAERATTKTRAAYEKLYRAQFLAGEIGQDAYHQKLIALGVPADQAEAVVALEVVKLYQLDARAELKEAERQAVKEQRAQADLYVRTYRAGNITSGVLLDRLLSIGVPSILAETTVELEVLKREEDAEKVLAQVIIPALKVPFNLAVKRLSDMLKAEEITVDEFRQELQASGLAQETADLIIEVLP